MNYIINIRDRRQVTLPAAVLSQLLVDEGDKLSLTVVDKKIVAQPAKEQAMDNLKAIQKAFQESGITEKELQDSGVKIRKQLVEKLHG